jgi:hypothetical protein
VTILENARQFTPTLTANGILTAGKHTPVSADNGPVTVTLPTSVHVGAALSVEKRDATTNAVIISGSIRGATSTISLAWQYETLTLRYDGSTWVPTEGHKTKAALDAAYASGGGGSTNLGGRSATLTVAASDAATKSKAQADYVCTGTNDQAVINTALAALPTNGGVLRLTEGTFFVDPTVSIQIQNDSVSLIGAGVGQRGGATQTGVGTKIVATTGTSGQVIFVQRAANDRPVYGVTLEDFTIDGQVLGTGVGGILFRSNRGRINRVHVHRMTGDGIRLWGYAAGAPAHWDTYDSHVTFCQVGDCASGGGIVFDLQSPDCHMVSCILYNNFDNVILRAASEQITSSHFYNATRNNVRFDGGGSRTKIVGCKIEGSGEHAINIDSTNGGYSDIQIVANGLSTNGDSVNNSFDHIWIGGPSANGVSRTQIVGNSFSHKLSQTPNVARYGVNVSNSAGQGTWIAANSFGRDTQVGTVWLNDNGNNSDPTICRANKGVPDNPLPDGNVTVQDEGVGLTPRNVIDFVGSGVTAIDDAANKRTVVSVSVPATAGLGGWAATDQGFLTWAFDPVAATQTSSVVTSGTANVVKVKLTGTTNVTGFLLSIGAAASTPGGTGNFGALYNSSKTLLGTSADQSASWNTSGVKQANFVAASAGSLTNLAPDWYYFVFWMTWTGTAPTVRAGVNSSIVNASLTAANSRYATADTGLTTTAPATLGTFAASNPSWWVALT